MAMLLCEICGGELVGKSGGYFECSACGMKYEKERVTELLNKTDTNQMGCKKNLNNSNNKSHKKISPIRRWLKILVPAIFVIMIIIGFIALKPQFSQMAAYKEAVNLMNKHNYTEAIEIFESLADYKDSKEKIEECKYGIADMLAVNGEYGKSAIAFAQLGEYNDSRN